MLAQVANVRTSICDIDASARQPGMKERTYLLHYILLSYSFWLENRLYGETESEVVLATTCITILLPYIITRRTETIISVIGLFFSSFENK